MTYYNIYIYTYIYIYKLYNNMYYDSIVFFLIVAYYNYSGICSMDFKNGLTSKDWNVRMIIGIILLGGKNNSMSCLSKMGLRP